jgi:threonine dehydrogenase-like Zn-dependent dehydrogenase
MPRMTDFGIRSPGHEGAGVVVKIGSNVKNWKVGDRGGVKPMVGILLSPPCFLSACPFHRSI